MGKIFYIQTKRPSDNQFVARAHQDIRIKLDGRNYIIKLKWIPRLEAWAFDLFDQNETPLVLGKIAANETNVLADNYWDIRIPRVAIYMGSNIPGVIPTFANLGSEVRLKYWIPQE